MSLPLKQPVKNNKPLFMSYPSMKCRTWFGTRSADCAFNPSGNGINLIVVSPAVKRYFWTGALYKNVAK
ncbi:hypothetical protein JTE90_021556 [Oedothorax gibbosus]|uniref:Uncharacterized protein n=1 Tax=Oedothorax gibbosus TaxID=931172 RepID=A0AAV6VQY9_9ARAC|nr:hypothetical protein JTE90_021556 [Oedothorax gibbosus]